MKLEEKNHLELYRTLPVSSADTRKTTPYAAFSKINELTTGASSNLHVLHLHVNNQCTSQVP